MLQPFSHYIQEFLDIFVGVSDKGMKTCVDMSDMGIKICIDMSDMGMKIDMHRLD
jgi:hypothetical protein